MKEMRFQQVWFADEKRPTLNPAGRRAGGSGQRRARVACQTGRRKARSPGRQTRPYIIGDGALTGTGRVFALAGPGYGTEIVV
jgi:hypothetical protein